MQNMMLMCLQGTVPEPRAKITHFWIEYHMMENV